jgi:hypothetical protein
MAIRGELCQALMSVAGMEIDDAYPPSGFDEGAISVSSGPDRAASREVIAGGSVPGTDSLIPGKRMEARSAPEPRKRKRGLNRGTAARANGCELPNDEIAIREGVRKAFMSIRGMKIDDVYPPSSGDEQIRD